VTGSQTRRCVKTNHGTVSKGRGPSGKGDRPTAPRSRLSPIPT
jgi:hypothetical protein